MSESAFFIASAMYHESTLGPLQPDRQALSLALRRNGVQFLAQRAVDQLFVETGLEHNDHRSSFVLLYNPFDPMLFCLVRSS